MTYLSVEIACMVLAKKEEISVLFLSTRWNSSRLGSRLHASIHMRTPLARLLRITFQAIRHVHIQYKPSYVLDLSFGVAYGCSIDILLKRFCYTWSQHVDYCFFVNDCYSSCWFVWLVGYIILFFQNMLLSMYFSQCS